VAFQLSDDLLDITSESAESGKTPGTDLREGVPTLATFHAMRSADPADARLRDLLSRPLPDDDEHAEALALLRAHPAMELARADLQTWADHARSVLRPLPDVPARDVLARLCDVVVERTS
jgi:heptaprenyl diphosphate synthase